MVLSSVAVSKLKVRTVHVTGAGCASFDCPATRASLVSLKIITIRDATRFTSARDQAVGTVKLDVTKFIWTNTGRRMLRLKTSRD